MKRQRLLAKLAGGGSVAITSAFATFTTFTPFATTATSSGTG
jgi:hypothetical protein